MNRWSLLHNYYYACFSINNMFTFGGAIILDAATVVSNPHSIMGCCYIQSYNSVKAIKPWLGKILHKPRGRIILEVNHKTLFDILVHENMFFKASNVPYTILRVHRF